MYQNPERMNRALTMTVRNQGKIKLIKIRGPSRKTVAPKMSWMSGELIVKTGIMILKEEIVAPENINTSRGKTATSQA